MAGTPSISLNPSRFAQNVTEEVTPGHDQSSYQISLGNILRPQGISPPNEITLAESCLSKFGFTYAAQA